MCVRIRLAQPHTPPTFNAEENEIAIPSDLSPAHSVTLVRAILTELVTVQPEVGAVCWCGAPVHLVLPFPQQRQSDQVVKHGA